MLEMLKVVKTNLTSDTLKSSVKCVLKKGRLSCKTLNASVGVLTFHILDVNVISRRFKRLRRLKRLKHKNANDHYQETFPVYKSAVQCSVLKFVSYPNK